MIKNLLLACCLCFLWNQGVSQKSVEVVKFEWYKNLRAINNDTTYVINFWATWCLPCVEELPEFEAVHSFYKNEKVKVILVSLDSYKKLNITLKPYLEKEKIQSEVVLLNEPNYDNWISKVDKKWEGEIPATIIFNNANKFYHFLASSKTADEIKKIISPNIHH